MRKPILVSLVLVLAIGFAFADDVQALLPEQAYEYLATYDNAYLIDVRTPCEYNWIGHPAKNLADDPDSEFMDGKVFHIPYLLWLLNAETCEYGMQFREGFVRDVVEAFPRDSMLIFICRSGGRSESAIRFLGDPANSNGHQYHKIMSFDMYNLLEGFEGGRDPVTRHRTLDKGWKNKGLPYVDGSSGIWTPEVCDDEGSDDEDSRD